MTSPSAVSRILNKWVGNTSFKVSTYAPGVVSVYHSNPAAYRVATAALEHRGYGYTTSVQNGLLLVRKS